MAGDPYPMGINFNWSTPTPTWNWFPPPHLQCDHCFCVEEIVERKLPTRGMNEANFRTKPHRQCCKCGDIRAVEFIKELK